MSTPAVPPPPRDTWRRRLSRAEKLRAARRRRLPRSWRFVTPLAFGAAGVLLVTSATNSAGTDLRPGRYDDLADLARTETARVQDLQDQIAALNGEIDTLTASVDSEELAKLQNRIDRLASGAHLTPVQGPGLSVTLDDAPPDVLNSAGDKVAQAVVHQQDLQAVVNALWAGGAEAMTLQDQRIIASTGIKCIGNTVLLNGRAYSPPYRIEAIGNAGDLRRSLDRSDYIDGYLQAVDEWQLGWEVSDEELVEAPAYEAPITMSYAQVADPS